MDLSDQVQYAESAFYGPFALWYLIKSPFPPGVVEAVSVRPDSSMDDDWQIYMATACSHGCVENVSLPLSLRTHSYHTMRDIFNTCWKGYDMPCKETILLAIQEAEYLRTRDSVDAQRGIIVTRCQTAFLRPSPKVSAWGVNITTLEGEQIGELCGDAVDIRKEVTSPAYDTSATIEFSAISLSGQMIPHYSTPELEAKSLTDVEGNSLARVPIVNVLMIGWEGSLGLAHRQALGRIYLIDWVKLRREWKTVMLG